MGILTIAETDALLADDEIYVTWNDLEDNFKQLYIDRGSAYVKLTWDYDETDTFDWDDNTTWPSGADSLVAQYFNEVAEGNIYPTATTGSDSQSPIKKKTQKLGPIEQTIEYAQPEKGVNFSTLVVLDDQMKALGFTYVSSKNALQRV